MYCCILVERMFITTKASIWHNNVNNWIQQESVRNTENQRNECVMIISRFSDAASNVVKYQRSEKMAIVGLLSWNRKTQYSCKRIKVLFTKIYSDTHTHTHTHTHSHSHTLTHTHTHTHTHFHQTAVSCWDSNIFWNLLFQEEDRKQETSIGAAEQWG